MRVLHVIPAIAARYGGPSDAAVQMCRALVEKSVDTTLAFTSTKGESDEVVETARAMRSPHFELKEFRRLASESFKYSPALARWLRREAGHFTVIHVHAIFSHSSISAMRHARRAERPYVIRPLGSLAPYSLARGALKKRVFLQCGLRSLIESAASVHCTSEQERDEISASFRVSRSFSVPNGVDDRLFTIDDTGREPLVAFIGRLHPKKNCESLIMAFSRFAEGEKEWRLVIAGDGDPEYVSHLHRLAQPARNIAFAGWLGPEAKLELLRRSSLFVLPSAHENFGIAAAEAMAAGVPVILSPGVNLSTAIANNRAGWVTEAQTAPLESTIAKALADPAEARRRAANARRLAEDFRWSRVASRLRQEYEAIA